ncbi:segregation and condensation protein A [Jeotgalibacillus alimentarius]|uniref:Segregation and condensation protein A n=1 Tax=Jeotgalibacillus alimentarius TaxID=135826 RepID=A0A0C2S4N1_9BACL|nr:segregation/condensation protein A [Jeotgalibacillus alimentarius]KIL48974.1 segregation and condensation protein A [Jeotgalibacillus alimentarius]
MEYTVKLDAFEGPLDLLLHLIQGLEIDIYDIPMAEISEQYTLYIKAMSVLELNTASEYLVMAATLMSIKSRMLLPKQEEDWEEDQSFEEDPREELVEKLIEYKKYKKAATELKQKEDERSLHYTKPPEDLSSYTDQVTAGAETSIDLHDLIGAFNKLMRRKKIKKPMSTRITRQEISIETRMSEILQTIRSHAAPRAFSELFPVAEKPHMVVSFMAVLELVKRQEIHIKQDHNFSEIMVESSEGVSLVGQR